MSFNKKNLRWLAIFITISLSLSCTSTSQQSVQTSAGKSLYLQNNIHSQVGSRDTKASYANWTDPGAGHIILPVNTSVEIGKYKRGFAIQDMRDGRIIYFEYNNRWKTMVVEFGDDGKVENLRY
jgi:hypothetical protein